jgi:hypothetical protein
MKLVTVSTSRYEDIDERDALYNLKIEGVESDSGFTLDEKAKQDKCGVEPITFDDSVPYEYVEEKDAPFHVELKNIINEFGVSGDDNTD